MHLRMKVIGHHLGEQFTDDRPRITVQVQEADNIEGTLRFGVNELSDFPLGSVIVAKLERA